MADPGAGSLRDDLLAALAELTENVLASPERTVDGGGGEPAIGAAGDGACSPRSARRELRPHDLSVALRQLRNLALASDRTVSTCG